MSGFEILIYMSDQHGAGVNDFMGDPVARTPNLDRLAGDTTALAVRVNYAPTHIAGLPVAVNINCHVSRHKSVIL